ncbi:MAG: DUF2961 domain-containing protein [Planctomycetia bacterium]|nr:DUF2961 domain-containing protein [Planctomycetia bacterium]
MPKRQKTTWFQTLLALVSLTVLTYSASASEVPSANPPKTVTFSSLLQEMLNRQAVLEDFSKNGNAEFICRQFSSYDRGAVSPTENWFANGDTAKFLREEENNGRKEWVLMDAEGPGAVVRWWITAPGYKSNFHIYIDGSDIPTFSGKIDEIVGGSALCGAPLSQETSRGRNLYLPIPYAKSIKITCDKMPEQGNLYYQINYRTYTDGTVVKSLTPQTLAVEKEHVATVNKTLENTGYKPSQYGHSLFLNPGETKTAIKCDFAGYITQFSLHVKAENLPQALRSVIIEMDFDGKNTVKCPLGDFFGTGVGINPYRTRWAIVEEDENDKDYNTLISLWTLPFREKAEIRLRNLSQEKVTVSLRNKITHEDRTLADIPAEDFLYFHANWHQEREIPTLGGQGTQDWNYVTIEGRGVYMGDVLSVVNRVPQWWGEGDEKIYIDGEKFPSHFGTGTEDYYGYAWCCPERFESPWRAQPRAEGPGNYGNTTNLRYRSLDRIPFNKSFRFDMEVWHWTQTKVDYAVTLFWYGVRDAKIVSPWATEDTDGKKFDAEAQAPVNYKTPFQMEMAGFHFAQTPPGNVSIQGMGHFKNGKWENNEQVWWNNGKPGDALEFRITIPKGAKTVTFGLTRACDYGIFEFYLDGIRLASPWDACNPVKGDAGVIHENITFPIPEEVQKSAENSTEEHRLTVYLVGKSQRSISTMFGMDKISWK